MESVLVVPGIIGSLLPAIISFVKQRTWSPMTKKIVAIVVSAAAALIAYFVQIGGIDAFDWEALLINFGTIYAFAQITYASFWKGTAVNTSLENTFASDGQHAA